MRNRRPLTRRLTAAGAVALVAGSPPLPPAAPADQPSPTCAGTGLPRKDTAPSRPAPPPPTPPPPPPPTLPRPRPAPPSPLPPRPLPSSLSTSSPHSTSRLLKSMLP